MPGNVDPIFSRRQNPNNGGIWTSSLTANTRSDGVGTIGTDMVLLFTAGAEGAYIDRIRLFPAGSVASASTTASCARFYLSTVSAGATTRDNTRPFAEIALPSQTTDAPTAAISYIEVPCDFAIPANTTILMSLHHAATANTSWQAIVFGGDY